MSSLTAGSYCLVVSVAQQTRIRVGALGELDFPAGCYIYVGSALNGLEHRIRRHAATNAGKGRAVHWHIDYLLSHPGVRLVRVYTITSNERVECRVSSGAAARGVPVPRFGCSDCRCRSHLYRVDSTDFLQGLGLSPVLL